MFEKLLSIDETAELLNICSKTVRTKVKNGELVAEFVPKSTVGRRAMKVTVSSIARYIKNH